MAKDHVIFYFNLNRYSKNASVATEFLSIETLQRATAENIYAAILQSLKEQSGLEPSEIFAKIVGFASDGASVMQGVRAGVAARIKVNQPKLMIVHCVAHRLELGIKDAINQSPLYSQLDIFLQQIYRFYHYSTLNRGLLNLTAKVMEVKRFIPLRTGGTRWVSHTEDALNNLLNGYSVIVQHLLEVRYCKFLSSICFRTNCTLPEYLTKC